MKSMTGYGRALKEEGTIFIEVEIKTVNNRYLKINTKIPNILAPYEPEIKKIIASKLIRGSVSVFIHYKDSSKTNAGVIDENLLIQYYKQISDVSSKLNLQPPSLDRLLYLPGVMEENIQEPIESGDWGNVRDVLEMALVELDQMRSTEGRNLQTKIQDYCYLIKESIENIKKLAPQFYDYYYNKLKNRMIELSAKEAFSFNESDIIKEVAFFAEKADITEETVRLQSHVSQLEHFLKQKGSVGKKFDFILQEMVREANTLTTKASNAEISTVSVNLKSLIEKIKEQIQNIE